MSTVTSLLITSLVENATPDRMLEDMERARRQLNKPLKTCKCGEGFNHRGYMCRECFEEDRND